MEKKERLDFIQSCEKYIEEKNIRDLMELLTKQLVLSQPADPLSYLINYLESNKVLRIFFLHGISDFHRIEIANAITSGLNYKKISFKEVLEAEVSSKGAFSQKIQKAWKIGVAVDDNIVNELILKAYNKLDKNTKGILFEGYPNTLSQSLFAQRQGIIPEKFFIIEYPEAKIFEEFKQQIEHKNVGLNESDKKQRASLMTSLYQQSLADLKSVNHEFFTRINAETKTKENLIDNILTMIKLKDKKKVPLRPPRILILRPPKLKKHAYKLTKQLAEMFDLVPINCYEVIKKEIERKTEIGKFSLQTLKSGEEIPDDIVLSLINTEINKTRAKIYGWVLEGFPKNMKQISKFISWNAEPTIVIALDDNTPSIKSKFLSLKIDPLNGESYEKVSIDEGIDPEVNSRLIASKQLAEDKLFEKIKVYKDTLESYQKKYNNRYIQFKLDSDSVATISAKINSMLLDNNIYK